MAIDFSSLTDMPTLLSILSLLVSILAFIYSYMAYRRDRSKVKIDVKFHLLSGHGTEFIVTVTNVGRRPLQIDDVILSIRSGIKLRPIFFNPIMLHEAENKDFVFSLHSHKEHFQDPLDFRYIEVVDSLGNRYVYPTWAARLKYWKLRRQIKREWKREKALQDRSKR